MDIRGTLEKLLEQVRQAETLAAEVDAQSPQFVHLHSAIKQTATLGLEQSKIESAESQSLYEGCFVAILDDLDSDEIAATGWEDGRLESVGL
jgi:hypothetical protein